MDLAPDDDQLLDALRARVAVDPRRPVGTHDVPHAYPPASEQDIEAAEAQLGFRLPGLLRRIYAEVTDGGFGPGYSLFPVRRGRDVPGQDESLVEMRNKLITDPRTPRTLLPLCDWGCAVWSALDCSCNDGPIVTIAGEQPLMTTGRDLRSWLQAWLAGVDLWEEMFEPGPTITGVNPFTKKPIEMKGIGKPKGRP